MRVERAERWVDRVGLVIHRQESVSKTWPRRVKRRLARSLDELLIQSAANKEPVGH